MCEEIIEGKVLVEFVKVVIVFIVYRYISPMIFFSSISTKCHTTLLDDCSNPTAIELSHAW